MILYLISGRGFTRSNSGRKISEVLHCFNEVVETDVLFGGDIPKERNVPSISSKSDYHAKWYRKNRFVLFFSDSFAEMKCLVHNHLTYNCIKKKGKNYELIWERSSTLHWAGILYAKRRGIPSVLEWKDHLIKDYLTLFRPLAILVEKWKVNNASFITVESRVLKDDLVKSGIPGDKIYITYNAVNPEEFYKDEQDGKSVRKELGFSETDLIVGYVGSYAFYHDSIRMVLAASILKNKGIDSIKWLLIGDGKDRPICEHYAKDHDLLGNSIVMLPFQAKERIPRYLSAMDVTILPGSTDIICPIKVMEYMAAKSVVLVPDYKCNREVINEGNGLLFEPGNENSIAEILEDLNENRFRCRVLGENARKTVVQSLTWDKTYGAVLSDILGKLNLMK